MTPDPIPTTLENPMEARSTAGMTTKVVKGSIWTLAGQVLPMAVSLVATPFTIRLLGSEAYGAMVLVALIPTYFSFADFGMSTASTKFASEAYADGDMEKEARVVRTAALIAFLVSFPIGTLLFAFSGSIVVLFNVPEHLYADASLALKFASITFVVSVLNGIFNTPQFTRLRMDLNALVTSSLRILGIIAVPIVIYLGGGIAGAVLVLMAASFLTLAGHIFISGRLLPALFGLTIDRSMYRPLLKFGSALVIAAIAAVALMNAEKGILTATASVTALAHYSVAFTLASMITMFSGAMVQSLFPAFSQLQSDQNREHLNSLFARGIRLNLIWLIPGLVFLSILAKPFFTVWAGAEFGRESVVPFYILVTGVAFNIVAYFSNTAILAAGRTETLAKLYWIELGPYALLVWVLASRFGATGAAVAWSMRVIVDAFIQFFLAKRVAGISYLLRHFYAFLAAGAIMALPFAANLYYGELRTVVIIGAFACFAAFVVIIWKFVLEKEEISWLTRRFGERAARSSIR